MFAPAADGGTSSADGGVHEKECCNGFVILFRIQSCLLVSSIVQYSIVQVQVQYTVLACIVDLCV